MAVWMQPLAVLCILLVSGVSQARFGFLPSKTSTGNINSPIHFKTISAPTLKYYGGPVISNVKLYVVLWSYANKETEDGVPDFYKKLTTSNFMDWLDQYNTFSTPVNGGHGTDQHIGGGQYMGTIRIKPFNHTGYIDDTEIQNELKKQIETKALPAPDDNTLYMVYFPPMYTVSAYGMTSCVDFCAYHSSHGTPTTEHFFYGVMPDINHVGCDQGCAYGFDHFSSVTAISSHEYTEAVTDPYPAPGSTVVYPQAWNADDGSEIGDLCAGANNSLGRSGDYFTVQSEFDNSTNKCTSKDWMSP